MKSALKQERRHLSAIRRMADFVIDTSKFNVHELRAHINERFHEKSREKSILVSSVSFGFRQGFNQSIVDGCDLEASDLAIGAALAGTIVPDFPLANKSFNLSYAGNDL